MPKPSPSHAVVYEEDCDNTSRDLLIALRMAELAGKELNERAVYDLDGIPTMFSGEFVDMVNITLTFNRSTWESTRLLFLKIN